MLHFRQESLGTATSQRIFAVCTRNSALLHRLEMVLDAFYDRSDFKVSAGISVKLEAPLSGVVTAHHAWHTRD